MKYVSMLATLITQYVPFLTVPPMLVVEPEEVILVKNRSSVLSNDTSNSAEFSCSVFSIPRAMITWTFITSSGYDITDDPRINITSVYDGDYEVSSYLTFTEIQFRDCGSVTCTADSASGTISSSTQLSIHGI